MTPLFAILLVTGICALLFFLFTLIGKFYDKIAEITRLDPKRGRQISIMIMVGALGISQLVDRWDRADSARSLSLDNKPTLVHSVQPEYPPLARHARVQGTVRFVATIGTNGRIGQLKLIKGNPLLVPAAADAAKQWIYIPPTTDGRPTSAKTEIDIEFQLDTPAPR